MAGTPISWDKLVGYGATVTNAAGQAWERVKKWQSERAKISSNAELMEHGEGSLTTEQLSDAVASQSELAKQLAEQANSMTDALSNLASRVSSLESARNTDAQFEEQTRQELARIRAELANQAVRNRWAMTIAALAIVLAGILAVLPHFNQ
jgi:translation initiation factor 2B subunit (eIF-2B alpha/beta/delta family)